MKKITIGVVLVAAVFVAFMVFKSGGTDQKANFSITAKNLVQSKFNKAVIEGKIKNTGSDEVARIVIKAKFFSETGQGLDEAFIMAGPIKAGEEQPFTIESYADYYKVTKFDVFVDSAQ